MEANNDWKNDTIIGGPTAKRHCCSSVSDYSLRVHHDWMVPVSQFFLDCHLPRQETTHDIPLMIERLKCEGVLVNYLCLLFTFVLFIIKCSP